MLFLMNFFLNRFFSMAFSSEAVLFYSVALELFPINRKGSGFYLARSFHCLRHRSCNATPIGDAVLPLTAFGDGGGAVTAGWTGPEVILKAQLSATSAATCRETLSASASGITAAT
jgi:hypothetical protein